MSRYLIVTHQTAFSAELQQRVRALLAEDPGAEFAVLVPEADGPTLSWEGESVDAAQQRAEAAQAVLHEETGARVVRAASGVSDPLKAIGDELTAHPGYDGLVICTLPVGVSGWLRRDLVHQAERRFGMPVIHVVAHVPRPVAP